MQKLETYIKSKGITSYQTKDLESISSLSILAHLEDSEITSTIYNKNYTDVEFIKMAEETKEKMETLFPGLNTSVPFIDEELLNAQLNSGNKTTKLIPILPTKKFFYIDAFKVDIKFVRSDDAFSLMQVASVDEENKIPGLLVNRAVIASKNVSGTLIGSYAHELVHMLTSRTKGLVSDYLEDDILSLFVEKLLNSESSEDYLRSESNRWAKISRHGLNDLTREGFIDAQRDYKSNVLANHLFSIYQSMSDENKVLLLEDVKETLNGKVLLSDLLNKYGVRLISKSCAKANIDSIEKCSEYVRTRSDEIKIVG